MKYERQRIVVSALQEGDTFEHPIRGDAICRVGHVSLRELEDGRQVRVLGYDIIEGTLHFPVVFLPMDFRITLLLPTTTFVAMGGKDWIDTLTEHHGVSDARDQ